MTSTLETRPRAYSYIRFSTPEQLKGDSLRRQMELSLAFAVKNGLELDDNLNMKDLGVSAFRGKNKTEGALAGFYKAIEKGTVRPGSYLLVESLDRLSRAQITEALTGFLQIINADIKVVTLLDNMLYDKQSLNENVGNLMMSLVVMARAHDESASKSGRLTSLWNNKRAKIHEQKLTARAPAWLELAIDRKSFRAIPERKKLVRLIFSLTLQGYGKRHIAKRFNAENIEPWGQGKRKENGERNAPSWHESYIQKILNNRAVLGEFQPCCVIDKKRSSKGPPIPNYFPRIIDEDTYNRVARKPGGYTGPSDNVSNLFTKIAFDGYTGATMHLVDKGTKNRGNGKWRYLVSDNRRLNPDSKRCSWAYFDFESLIMKNLVEIDWINLALEGDASELDKVNYQIADLESQMEKCETVIKRLMTALESTNDPPAKIVKGMKEQEEQQENLSEQIAEKTRIKTDLEQRGRLLQMSPIDLKKAAEKRQDVGVRRKLREELRRRIKRIDLYPNGLKRNMTDGTSTLHIYTLYRAAAITFINGVVRWVLPSPGSTETICWHVVPTRNGPKFALSHGFNFTESGICKDIKMSPNLKVMFSPAHADELKSGKHESVKGLDLAATKDSKIVEKPLKIGSFTPPKGAPLPSYVEPQSAIL